jgi:hypothetical protein
MRIRLEAAFNGSRPLMGVESLNAAAFGLFSCHQAALPL